MSDCPLCGETVADEDEPRLIGTPEGKRLAHRECLLRVALGGIGHLEDHAHWCEEMNDPDGGRTLRQSALEVDAWVQKRGTYH